MPLVCTICTGICGSGVQTPGTITTRVRRVVAPPPLTREGVCGRLGEIKIGECCAAVPGTVYLGTAVLLFASTATRSTAPPISGFGLSASRRGLLALSSFALLPFALCFFSLFPVRLVVESGINSQLISGLPNQKSSAFRTQKLAEISGR